MSQEQLIGDALGPSDLSPERICAAMLTIADRAVDAAECRRLLDMCGLLPKEAPRGR
jgi:hypothetical protein